MYQISNKTKVLKKKCITKKLDESKLFKECKEEIEKNSFLKKQYKKELKAVK